MMGSIIVFVVVALIAAKGMMIYNRLVRLRFQVERAWSNIDVILKQRYDELPQLIQVIEQFAQYESDIINQVTTARTQYGQASSVEEKIQASSDLSLALRGVMAIGEDYPEIKANDSFMQLQTRISSLENMIADRREVYNEMVTNFNTLIHQIPEVVVARLLSYHQQVMFKTLGEERQTVDLKMNLPGRHAKGA